VIVTHSFLVPACAAVAAALTVAASLAGPLSAAPPAQSGELDALMRQVLEKRDENWKKLQQYVLDEREQFELRGPTGATVWGERRDYTWYIRDGFFVRSPLSVNGAAVSERDRRAFEAQFLKEAQERDRRGAAGSRTGGPDGSAATPANGDSVERPGDPAGPGPNDGSGPVTGGAGRLGEVDAFLRQSRQPQFITSAYFLRFKFEAGRYALVGREQLDGRDVLRVEHYPAALFADRRMSERRRDDPVEREARRLMSKVSLVTLWIEPVSQQILQYTFNNVAVDFLPSQWLARINDVRASMVMGQPFPDVWLPKTLDIGASLTLAVGRFDLQYGLEYHGYRRAEVGSKIIAPDGR
jgi:hypothetical protein